MNNLSRIVSIYFLPGLMLLSVLIGGGFATGREIVEYGAKFGAAGWMSGVTSSILFFFIGFLSFEFSRRHKAYNYRKFLTHLLGRFWWIFDLLFILLSVLIIAVMTASFGDMLHQIINLPHWIGMLMLIISVAIILGASQNLLEQLKSWGALLLIIAYVFFAFLVFQSSQTSIELKAIIDPTVVYEEYMQEKSTLYRQAIWQGLLYVGYNIAVFPAILSSTKHIQLRKQSFLASLIAGALVAVPWFLTYSCLMLFYPSASIFESSVPWLAMLEKQSSLVLLCFGLVVSWTLIATAVGLMNALLKRVDDQLIDNKKSSLSRKQRSIYTLFFLLLSLLLSQVGVVDLIASGYTLMAYALILVFVVPLIAASIFSLRLDY